MSLSYLFTQLVHLGHYFIVAFLVARSVVLIVTFAEAKLAGWSRTKWAHATSSSLVHGLSHPYHFQDLRRDALRLMLLVIIVHVDWDALPDDDPSHRAINLHHALPVFFLPRCLGKPGLICFFRHSCHLLHHILHHGLHQRWAPGTHRRATALSCDPDSLEARTLVHFLPHMSSIRRIVFLNEVALLLVIHYRDHWIVARLRVFLHIWNVVLTNLNLFHRRLLLFAVFRRLFVFLTLLN